MKGQVSDITKEMHEDIHFGVCLSLDVLAGVIFI